MKYFKKLKQYKASNVTLTVHPGGSVEAWSYGWWQIVRTVGGVVYLNNYNYSNTTARHRYKVIEVLDELGIKYRLVSVAAGLQADFTHWIIPDSEIKAELARADKARKPDNRIKHKNYAISMIRQNLLVQYISRGRVSLTDNLLYLSAKANYQL